MKFSCLAALGVGATVIFQPIEAATPTPEASFQGSLAGKEIVFHFLSPGDTDHRPGPLWKLQRARYFYRSAGHIIPLVNIKSGWLAECKADFHNLDCGKPTGYWLVPPLIKDSEQSEFTATWKHTELAPGVDVRFTAVKPDADSNLDPWTELLGTGPTRLMKVLKRNSVVTGVLVDTRSKAKVPQLLAGYPGELMARFNARMKSRLVHDAAATLENISLEGGAQDDHGIHFQSPRWLVWGGGGGGYYGGNHDLFHYSAEVFDMKTGEEVDARTALFKHLSVKSLDSFIPTSSYVGTFEYSRIPHKWLRSQGVIEALVLREASQVARALPDNPAPAATPSRNACVEEWLERLTPLGDEDEDGAMTATKGLSRNADHYRFNFELMPRFNGLAVVSNDFPEVARGCRGIMLTIPWHKVKPYLNQAM